jgi:flagellar basal body-associated protein FliL
MYRNLLIIALLVFTSLGTVFAQRVPSVGIISFGVTGDGVTASDAANLTNRVIEEFRSWGTLNIIQGVEGAEYIIRGTLSRHGNNFVLSAATLRAASNSVLNEYNEQARAINDISISMFCTKAVERVSLPNYLLGTWQSTINMPDGPVVCIIEFRTDRSVVVTRYDTWEHRQRNALRYEGFGTGTYTYLGFANRLVNIGGRQVRIDATIGVNLALEETLPDQASVSQSGLHIVFNGDRTSFEIVNGMFPCGRNFDGPSVYHSAVLGFTQFVKIR